MPTPKKNEKKDEFIQRCMAFLDMQRYKSDQRFAICNDMWKKGQQEKSSTFKD